MKKYLITVSEEQISQLRNILCRTVMESRDEAVSLARDPERNTKRCMELLEVAANADAIWTAVNRAEIQGGEE
jgi:hypothetical protein